MKEGDEMKKFIMLSGLIAAFFLFTGVASAHVHFGFVLPPFGISFGAPAVAAPYPYAYAPYGYGHYGPGYYGYGPGYNGYRAWVPGYWGYGVRGRAWVPGHWGYRR